MTKKDFVAQVATKTGLPVYKATKFVDAVLETIQESLVEDERIALPGFGTFEVRERGVRQGRNPQTGEAITIPPRKYPCFKPGIRFREMIDM